MSGPIYGGSDPKTGLNDVGGTGQKGVYAEFPAATPKYNASNHLAALDTQARLYIEIPDQAAYRAYLASIPPSARAYAEAMTRTTGSSGGKGYLSFFLVSAQEPLREKVQVSEVLSDTHIAYYFGQSAPVWNYSIGLINSQQDEWYDAWNIVYENIIRGTKLAENKVSVTLAYDTRRVIGSVMGSQTGLSAANELAVNGSFSILVKELQVAIKVTDSLELAAAQLALDEAALAELEGGFSQVETKMVPALAIQRQLALDGSQISEETAGVRSGFNPEEVQLKTGVRLTSPGFEFTEEEVENAAIDLTKGDEGSASEQLFTSIQEYTG
jgi:hypothetical protein